MNLSRTFLVLFLFFLGLSLSGEVSLPNIFGDHMVLQRDQDNPIWGTASPGEVVSVFINEQKHTCCQNAQVAHLKSSSSHNARSVRSRAVKIMHNQMCSFEVSSFRTTRFLRISFACRTKWYDHLC